MQTFKTVKARASVLLLAACFMAPACGARSTPNLTPQQVEQSRLRDLRQSAETVKRIGEMVESFQLVEIELHKAGRIPRDTHIAAQTYFDLSASFVIAALDTAKDQTKPVEERLNGIQMAMKLIDGLKSQIVDKLPDAGARTQLGLVLTMVQTLLLTWSMQT